MTSCRLDNKKTAVKNSALITLSDSTILTVATTEASLSAFTYRLQANGKVGALEERLFVCEVPATIEQCEALPGKFFTAGTVIIRTEPTPILQKIERAELVKFNAQKEYESLLLGYESLLTEKATTTADEIKKKLKISTGLAYAEQDIKEANYELDKSIIKAPFNGIIADVKIRKGERLKAGQEMFRIYDPTQLVLEIKILESDIAMIDKNTLASVSPLANPTYKYAAKVHDINPYVDENGMVTVRLRLPGVVDALSTKPPPLLPGMNCLALLQIPQKKAVLVPKESVVMRSGRAVVFTVLNGKAKWNYVQTGHDNGEIIEIKSGIDPGARVIITNNLQLSHDVSVKETTTDRNVKL